MNVPKLEDTTDAHAKYTKIESTYKLFKQEKELVKKAGFTEELLSKFNTEKDFKKIYGVTVELNKEIIAI